jgi:DNA-binding response OmpR family regulator
VNILILDDEVYLAHKVEARLQDDGYHTTRYSYIDDVDFRVHYDTILLSTNLTGDIKKILNVYKKSVILLLVTFVSETTVTKLINEGASDYILKPFILDELVRKIKHYEQFHLLEKENKKLKEYLEFIFQETKIKEDIPNRLPFLIEANDNLTAKKIVFDVAKRLNKEVEIIPLQNISSINISKYENKLLYLYGFNNLKKIEKRTILRNCENKNIILSSNDYEDIEFDKITLMTKDKLLIDNTILTVNDYVKYITLTYQSKYPDTELSKRLGISRKSLWEKRRKFGIEKKKR